jgi:hypothetical protein
MIVVPLCGRHYWTTYGVGEVVVLSASRAQDIHYPVTCS